MQLTQSLVIEWLAAHAFPPPENHPWNALTLFSCFYRYRNPKVGNYKNTELKNTEILNHRKQKCKQSNPIYRIGLPQMLSLHLKTNPKNALTLFLCFYRYRNRNFWNYRNTKLKNTEIPNHRKKELQAIKPYLSNWLAAHAFSPPENQPMERTDIFLDELNLKTFFGASKNSKTVNVSSRLEG